MTNKRQTDINFAPNLIGIMDLKKKDLNNLNKSMGGKMKIKLIALFISGISCINFANFAYAEDYSSSQSSSQGSYSSSNSSSNSEYYSSGGGSKQPNSEYYSSGGSNKGGSFSFSVNTPNFNGSYVIGPEDSYFVVDHSHRYLGPQWINMTQGMRLPVDAIVGGGEMGNLLYICRGNFREGLHPGKLMPDGSCDISWGGNEISLSHYQVLVSHLPIRWVSGSYGYIPDKAIVGGHENGSPLYICQVDYRGGRYPGKIIGQMCNIAWNGREIAKPFYEVLVR